MFRAFASLADAATAPGPRVVTIGNFGVHLGHQRILEEATALANERGWKATALTFDPHPTRVVAPERAPALMTTIAQRLERFAALGLDEGLVLPFNADVARLSPEEFARDVLAETLAARRGGRLELPFWISRQTAIWRRCGSWARALRFRLHRSPAADSGWCRCEQ
ncbi:MAG: hypothetical protein R2748_21390 [Bryobacterales bacterium]